MNWRERLERFNAVLDAGVAAYKGFADALGSAMQKTRGQPYRNVDVLLCFALQGFLLASSHSDSMLSVTTFNVMMHNIAQQAQDNPRRPSCSATRLRTVCAGLHHGG